MLSFLTIIFNAQGRYIAVLVNHYRSMHALRCPNCKSPLHPTTNTASCTQGHTFDVSKGGYLNLLLPHKKKSTSPGDNKPMITARDSFLSTGAFDFLTENIATSVPLPPLSPGSTEVCTLLDIGCGTGYYTRMLWPASPMQKIGIDISKNAVTKAAAKDKTATYIVGSAYDLPVADRAADIVLNVFSPVDMVELRRVLAPTGCFVKVIPIGDHMREVAELVYDTFRPHQSTIVDDLQSDPSLTVVRTEHLTKTVTLTGAALQDLIAMTPYVYKFSTQQLVDLQSLTVTFSFMVIVAQSKS